MTKWSHRSGGSRFPVAGPLRDPCERRSQSRRRFRHRDGAVWESPGRTDQPHLCGRECLPAASLKHALGGYARVPLRSPRGDLAGQLATLPRESLACGNAPGGPRCGNRLTGNRRAPTGWRPCSRQRRSRWSRVGSLSCLVDGVHRALLAWTLHLPPSAVPLVSDVRFRRSVQRLARLT